MVRPQSASPPATIRDELNQLCDGCVRPPGRKGHTNTNQYWWCIEHQRGSYNNSVASVVPKMTDLQRQHIRDNGLPLCEPSQVFNKRGEDARHFSSRKKSWLSTVSVRKHLLVSKNKCTGQQMDTRPVSPRERRKISYETPNINEDRGVHSSQPLCKRRIHRLLR